MLELKLEIITVGPNSCWVTGRIGHQTTARQPHTYGKGHFFQATFFKNMSTPNVTLSLQFTLGPILQLRTFCREFQLSRLFSPFASNIPSTYIVHELCISLRWTSAAPRGAELLHACSSEEARTKGAALPAEVLPKCAGLVSAGRSLLPHLLCDPYKRKWGESVNLHALPKSFSNVMFISGFWICGS